MIRYTEGNLLEADAEALVNTVNTVGVMGKGIALMFKEAFAENFVLYAAACKTDEVEVGRMFVTERNALSGPRWIINFPTKKHWRHPSKLQWIVDGLEDLRRVIEEQSIRSVAIPPLGSGNGGLEWSRVRREIETRLSDLEGVDVIVYQPTRRYQNVAKKQGVQKLTPARALIAELVRRYWVLGIECSLLEIQKLAWFLERNTEPLAENNPLDFRFKAHKYGPYAYRLEKLLDALDGSYLHCDKRIADASPIDVIAFDDTKKGFVAAYLQGADARPFIESLEKTAQVMDGFESPMGLELLATVDWMICREGCVPKADAVLAGLAKWPGGGEAARRKQRLFDQSSIELALERLQATGLA